MVVAQVWRGRHGRQVNLARLLRRVDARAVSPGDGRAAGILQATAGTADAIDATVVLLAAPGDRILTSDPGDPTRLAGGQGTGLSSSPVARSDGASRARSHHAAPPAGQSSWPITLSSLPRSACYFSAMHHFATNMNTWIASHASGTGGSGFSGFSGGGGGGGGGSW
jgi:hypothetical protein